METAQFIGKEVRTINSTVTYWLTLRDRFYALVFMTNKEAEDVSGLNDIDGNAVEDKELWNDIMRGFVETFDVEAKALNTKDLDG